jgi:Predicted integral membrane protein
MDQIKARNVYVERVTPIAATTADPQARVELHAALDAVSAEHREPFLLVEVFGLSYQEDGRRARRACRDDQEPDAPGAPSDDGRARGRGGGPVNHDQAERLLSARIDGERLSARATATLEQHLGTCAECRAFERGAYRLREAARFEVAPAVPDLVDEVMTAVGAQTERPRSRLRWFGRRGRPAARSCRGSPPLPRRSSSGR